jgi:hypothetical protein
MQPSARNLKAGASQEEIDRLYDGIEKTNRKTHPKRSQSRKTRRNTK